MNKTPRLGKSKIEYLDYVWNFYSGCHNWRNGVCPIGENCWALKRTKRFKHLYPNGFEPTFYPEAFLSPLHLKKPSIIGCAFMGDLFGDWVDPDMKFHSVMPSGKASITMSLKGWIFTTIEQCPQHTFLFLTKCPQNLPQWSPFPQNCYVGVTATNYDMARRAIYELNKIEASVKYISFEPLLAPIYTAMLSRGELDLATIHWVIIGACTGTLNDLKQTAMRYPNLALMPYGKKWTLQPPIEWVEEISKACVNAGIPLFLKDNLKPLLEKTEPFVQPFGLGSERRYKLRQELPDADSKLFHNG